MGSKHLSFLLLTHQPLASMLTPAGQPPAYLQHATQQLLGILSRTHIATLQNRKGGPFIAQMSNFKCHALKRALLWIPKARAMATLRWTDLFHDVLLHTTSLSLDAIKVGQRALQLALQGGCLSLQLYHILP